jgi:outer membrane protein assembly factor BamB
MNNFSNVTKLKDLQVGIQNAVRSRGPKSGRFAIASAFLAFIFMVAGAATTFGDGWPTYRRDIARSGVTSESIGHDLFGQWVYVPCGKPKPAWPMPGEELPRIHADNGYYVAAVDGSVYFGSSVTNKVFSIDAATGKIRWTFVTQGPVRFAPTVANGKVYFGSDDGWVYCVSAENGEQLWKYRAGPSGEKVLGNGRMISLWPVRTSLLVDQGIVYFGAGVFPYEGIFICALNAGDGSIVWKNDTVGDYSHELAFGGISPQGYLVASESMLYVPSGRAMPAVFERKTGKFKSYMPPSGKRGGTWALLDGDSLITGVDYSGTPHKVAYDANTGKRQGDVFAWFPGIDIIPTKEISYVVTSNGVYAINRAHYSEVTTKADKTSKQRKELGSELWRLKRQLRRADEAAATEINTKIDERTGRFDELTKMEDEAKASSYKWHYKKEGLCSLMMAGDVLFAGGEGFVVGIDVASGKELWKSEITGKAVGLAASDGRLFISSDEGPIYCFAPKKTTQIKEIRTAINLSPYGDTDSELYVKAAEKIIQETAADKGYCLVLDCGQGQLAYELAKRTQLKIVGIEKDPQKIAVARKKLEAAGLLGKRVVVEPWDISDLPQYFANLVVSDGMLKGDKTSAAKAEIERVVRPYGGVSMFGSKGWFGKKISWKRSVRGPLVGAGSWRQQYGNESNTACSEDDLVKGSLGVLWFGDPGSEKIVERHARAVSPVAMNGRVFVQGEEVIMAYDAYNGTLLWERDLPGAVRVRVDVDSGNLALTEDALYVAAFDKCYRLNAATGAIENTYALPGANTDGGRRWGHVSCIDGTLIGTVAKPLNAEYAAGYKAEYGDGDGNETVKKANKRGRANWGGMGEWPSWGSQRGPKNSLTSRLMGGDTVFAVDAKTGKELWKYRGEDIANITVTVGDGKVFFVDSKISDAQRTEALEEKKKLADRKIYVNPKRKEAQLENDQADVRAAVAVDIKSGDVLWKKAIDFTGCGGDKMGTAYKDGVLIFLGNYSNHDTGFFKNNELTWRRITALDTTAGDTIWSRPLNYLRRPLIVGDKIIIEPRACDLRTGEIIMRKNPITGQACEWEFLRPGHCCAVTSASKHMLFYRSYNVAMYNLTEDKGVDLFGGIRPGCWINMIPASGLMLMPEASSGCTCSFPIRCSVAMVDKPKRVASNWTVFINHGDQKPVKHLAVNFGAPGDMRDDNGRMWFGYPRPKAYSGIGYGNYGVKLQLSEEVTDGMGPYCRDYRGVNIDGSDKPWLFTSGYRGLLSCKLPLIDDAAGQKQGRYTVRLGFKALATDKPGDRVFDVKLNGKAVLTDFDILQKKPNPNKVVIKEFKGVPVKSNLLLQLVPKVADCGPERASIISFVEVIREDSATTSKIALDIR